MISRAEIFQKKKCIETKDFAKKLSDCIETTVEIPRLRAGKRQAIKPLIMEEEK